MTTYSPQFPSSAWQCPSAAVPAATKSARCMRAAPNVPMVAVRAILAQLHLVSKCLQKGRASQLRFRTLIRRPLYYVVTSRSVCYDMAFLHLGPGELVASKDIGESFFEKVSDNTPDIVSPRSVRLSRELVIRQHIPQHFGEPCDHVWLDHLPKVLHGNDPLWQELHQDACARTFLLFVWHGTMLNEPWVEKYITRISCNMMGLFDTHELLKAYDNSISVPVTCT